MRRQLGFGRQAVLAAGALVLGGLLFDGATASAHDWWAIGVKMKW